MSDVKRYEPEGSFDGCAGWMRTEAAGGWVSFEDYTALRARLNEVTEERNVQNDLRQIAEDAADELRARAERAEAALATARQLVTHAATELAQSAQDMNAMRAERALHKAIRALANEAET